MDSRTLDYLMNRMESRRGKSRDGRDYEDGARGRDSKRGSVDFEGSMDFRDEKDYRDYRSSKDYRDSAHYEDSRDMRDYRRMKLSKTDIHHWKQMMENEDGSRGPHYDMQQIIEAAGKAGIRFDEFDEKEFCMAVNMMYSDYCKVAKQYVAPDKELHFFVDLAKAFLEDEDGPEASEKLALYFHCIVDA